jgi:two-component system OmpR family response regulator
VRVLVIEDDVEIAALVARGLTAEGFGVEVAHDGPEGLWLAKEAAVDLVVLDLMLPGRNGFQVCADLRAADIWTPILVLTAKDGELDEAEALDTGADDYLTKPFSFPVLVSRIHALLRRSAHSGPAVTTVGALALDARRREARCEDRLLDLTSREFDVLELLVRNHGEVLSKEAILRGVWPFDFDGDPNVVEVYVARLRRKMGDCPADLIDTIRGAGYRLRDDHA